ncbi:MAG: DNA gyrase subunit A [Planctomycetales bacterium 4484_113]|nr:MAG: DNA gyrase subunit A [Planctomycetales bacterium 4484_113]
MDLTERIEFDEKIFRREIVEELEESYLDYAMSVIVGRAIPDLRDGLKVIHRRIIYAMAEGGYGSEKPTNKSARIVGEVMGKFHPHGDAAIYDAVARMAQPWSLRYPLLEGQGNFGSIDGDAPAAMRYTEVRMRPLAEYLVADIKKQTVDFVPTFDGKGREPVVLPSGLPVLLMNGTEGIAVGMATRIPPHNLNELAAAIRLLVDNPEATVDDLMKCVKGPDFPTGGFILGRSGIEEAYRTGKGSITIRGRAEVEQDKRDRYRIVITEIPYQVNKSTLVETIAHLASGPRRAMSGFTDIRDESDRNGIRVVLELKRDANPQVILNNLYKNTQLQITYHIINLALVNGAPRVLNLREMLTRFVEYRREIIVRRTKFDLEQAEARAHILEGLKVALDHLDEVIAVIKACKDQRTASFRLQEEFGLSADQAKAILEMRLGHLTNLEQRRVLDELKAVRKKISDYEAILADSKKVDRVLVRELDEATSKFGDERRTVILSGIEGGEFSEEDLVKSEFVVVSITRNGYIKRVPLSTFRVQARGGRGLIGQTMKADDVVQGLVTTNTLDTILCFTDHGNVHSLRVFQVPAFERTAKGTPIINLVGLTAGEKVTALVSLEEFSQPYLFMCTRRGIVKKCELSKFVHLRTTGKRAISLEDNDSLDFVLPTSGKDRLIISTRAGRSVCFDESEVRPMGRTARGVLGVRLRDREDAVIGIDRMKHEHQLLVVSKGGYGKRTSLSEFRVTHRGTRGIICMKTRGKTGPVVAAHAVEPEDEVIIISAEGMIIRTQVSQISQQGRSTQGVKVINLKPGDRVSAVEIIKADKADSPLFE